MRNHFLFLILGLLAAAGCGGDDESSSPAQSYEGDETGECNNGADDDRDGLFDCKDPGCAGAPICTQTNNPDAGLDATVPDAAVQDAAAQDAAVESGVEAASPDAASGDSAVEDAAIEEAASQDAEAGGDAGPDAKSDVVCVQGPENSEAACSDGCSNDGDAWVDCDDYDCDGSAACLP